MKERGQHCRGRKRASPRARTVGNSEERLISVTPESRCSCHTSLCERKTAFPLLPVLWRQRPAVSPEIHGKSIQAYSTVHVTARAQTQPAFSRLHLVQKVDKLVVHGGSTQFS